LMSYRLGGYRSGPKMDETVPPTPEGQATSKSWNPFSVFGRHSSNQPTGNPTIYPQPEPASSKPWTQWFGKRPANQPSYMTTIPPTAETPPPPLAQPSATYLDQPRTSARPQLVPTNAPKLQRAPSPSQSSDAGPDLPPG